MANLRGSCCPPPVTHTQAPASIRGGPWMGDRHVTHHRLLRGGPEGSVDVGLQRRPTASLPCLPMPVAQSHDSEGRWQTTVHLDASCGLHIPPSGKSWGGGPPCSTFTGDTAFPPSRQPGASQESLSDPCTYRHWDPGARHGSGGPSPLNPSGKSGLRLRAIRCTPQVRLGPGAEQDKAT